jgi:NADPH:quinone reductase-like Zn-dependent oxidoreductase
MKALMFDKLGRLEEALELKEVEIPRPGPGQVLVKVMASPINPSDFMYARGNYRLKPQLPAVAGLEGSGLVVATGTELASIRPGTHVAFRARGVWAEYCLVEADRLYPIASKLSFVASGQLTLNALTAYALLDELGLQPGDTLLLNAAGSSVAFLLMQLALQRQIRIIALVSPGTDTGYFPQHDDLKVLSTDTPELAQAVLAASGTREGMRGFLDAVGGPALSELLPAMAPFGKIISYGNLSNDIAAISTSQIIYRNLSLTGFGIDQWREKQDRERLQEIIAGLADAVAAGSLKLKPVSTVPLADWKEGISRISGGNTKMVWIADSVSN